MNAFKSLAWCVMSSGLALSLAGPCLAQDADGDGFDDLAVSVPIETVGGAEAAGGVQVFQGSNLGVSASDKFWSQDTAGIADSSEEDDYFGSTFAWGDFNDDGFDDLAIGIPGEVINGVVAGAVSVLYGISSGLDDSGDQLWHQDSSGITGEAEANDLFGWSLATGDFNRDGFDDLAIGAPGETLGAVSNAGVVHVLYGSEDGLTGSGDQLWSQDTDGVQDVAEAGDFFGWALAAGDFDDDGRDDLAISAVNEEVDGQSDTGMVHVLYGRNSGLSAGGDQIWHQNISGIADSCEANDAFGFALTVGDFDGDDNDDLAIGVSFEDIGGSSDAGAVHVLYGSNDGLKASGDDFWHQDSDGISGAPQTSDRFGDSICAGDFDGDGFDDLAIGIPNENSSSVNDSGAVAVLYGTSSGLTSSGDQLWSQDSSGIQDACEVDDRFGYSVYTGDFDGDGRDDLVIAAPFENVDGIDDVGYIHVIYGTGTGLRSTDNQRINQDTPGAVDSSEANNQFGLHLRSL